MAVQPIEVHRQQAIVVSGSESAGELHACEPGTYEGRPQVRAAIESWWIMVSEHLATYLNDHLAGAVAAIDLLAHLEEAHVGTSTAQVLAVLRADVEADRQELKDLMEQLHIAESRPRQVTAWLAEKGTELKLRLDDSAGGALRLLEASEAVALGIEGKRALWGALATAAAVAPRLQALDYAHLIQRAEEQRYRIEQVRLEAARVALTARS